MIHLITMSQLVKSRDNGEYSDRDLHRCLWTWIVSTGLLIVFILKKNFLHFMYMYLLSLKSLNL